MSWVRAGRFVVIALFIAGLTCAAAWSVHLGWADFWFQRLTVPDTEKAIKSTPGQGAYWARLGLMLSDEDPARSEQAFKRAVELNPLDGNSWIELGLKAEADGDTATAEQYLLRAWDVDHGYLPRWSLANFYFRQNRAEPFWYWIHQSALMAYGDTSPLFRLCWQFTQDGQLIEQRLGLETAELQSGYLSYLLNQNLIDSEASAAKRLMAWNREQDTDVLMLTCDRLLLGKRESEALEIWNGLAQSHRIPFPRLDPAAGISITNGDFAVPPTSHGFDWRLPTTFGISASQEEHPPAVRLAFSGDQSENSDGLLQFAPVREKSHYTLRFRYRTSGIAPGTGVMWFVSDGISNKVLGQTQSLSADADAQGELSFSTPPGCRLLALALVYRRSPGTTRIQGAISIREVQLAG